MQFLHSYSHTHTHEVIEKNSLSDGPKMLVKNFERNKVIYIYIERIKNTLCIERIKNTGI